MTSDEFCFEDLVKAQRALAAALFDDDDADAAARAVGRLWASQPREPVIFCLQQIQKKLRACANDVATDDERKALAGLVRRYVDAPSLFPQRKKKSDDPKKRTLQDQAEKRDVARVADEARERETARAERARSVLDALCSCLTLSPDACKGIHPTWVRRAADGVARVRAARPDSDWQSALVAAFRVDPGGLSPEALVACCLLVDDDVRLDPSADVSPLLDAVDGDDLCRRRRAAAALLSGAPLPSRDWCLAHLGDADPAVRDALRRVAIRVGGDFDTGDEVGRRREDLVVLAANDADAILTTLLAVSDDDHAFSMRRALSEALVPFVPLHQPLERKLLDGLLESRDETRRMNAAAGVALCLRPERSIEIALSRKDDGSRHRRHGALLGLRGLAARGVILEGAARIALDLLSMDAFDDVRVEATKALALVFDNCRLAFYVDVALDLLARASGSTTFVVYYNLEKGRPLERDLAKRRAALAALAVLLRGGDVIQRGIALALAALPLAAWCKDDDNNVGKESRAALDATGLPYTQEAVLAALDDDATVWDLAALAAATPALREAAYPDAPHRDRVTELISSRKIAACARRHVDDAVAALSLDEDWPRRSAAVDAVLAANVGQLPSAKVLSLSISEE